MVPSWLEEPAKRVGWLVSIVLLVCNGLLELVNEFADLIPASAQPRVRELIAATTVVVVVASRAQALLTRAHVWSPASVKRRLARRPLPAPRGTEKSTGA